jgi:signal transduction histidine kinase
MQGLVTNLLELARTDETIAGDANAKRKVDVDFSDMVQSAALEFDAMAFEHGCSIDEKVQEGIHITGDPDWLARLVKILIDNAIKYAGEKTVVTVQLTKESNKVHLVVNDHGQVINPEDLKHVFDRFYRSDKARSRSTGGFGLGLAIAKGITESHGGSIAAQSNEADGTTFTVTL